MARPRASDRVDYGLVWLMPISRYREGRITDAQLCEVVRLYGDALMAFREGRFDSGEIPPPSIMALDEDGWRKHIETFIDGIAKIEAKRAKDRGVKVSAAKTPQGKGISATTTPVFAAKTPQEKRRENERNTSEVNFPEENAHSRGASVAAAGVKDAAAPCASPPPMPTAQGLPPVCHMGGGEDAHADGQKCLGAAGARQDADTPDADADYRMAFNATMALVKSCGINTDAEKRQALVVAVSGAGEKHGWRKVASLVEAEQEALEAQEGRAIDADAALRSLLARLKALPC